MKKFNKFSLLAMLLAFTALFTVSCSDDDNQDQGVIPDAGPDVKAVILNQGQFSKGNASLSILLEDGSIKNDVFRETNGRPLGDVAQSLMYKDGKYFIVLNNSKKIEVIDAKSFKSLQTILFKEEVQPRYMVSTNANEALVSDANGQLIRINTTTYEAIETIPTPDFTAEQMICVGGKLFCTAPYSGAGIYVYNTQDLHTPVKLNTSYAPAETAALVLDANNKLWALCAGLNMGTLKKESVLYGIDPATTKVTDTIALPAGISASSYPRLASNIKSNKLYFDGKQNDKNYVFEVDPIQKTVQPYMELSGLGMTYGMNISSDGNVFICDCLDYSAQRAYVREYRTDGSFFSYKVGIYPGQIYFTEDNK